MYLQVRGGYTYVTWPPRVQTTIVADALNLRCQLIPPVVQSNVGTLDLEEIEPNFIYNIGPIYNIYIIYYTLSCMYL